MTLLRRFLLFFAMVFLAPVVLNTVLWWASPRPANWRSADWSSAGVLQAPLASDPAEIRVYVARTGGLKGAVAHHSWILLRERGADAWTRYDVVGWGRPVRRNSYPPDGRWYGNMPELVGRVSGADAARAIPRLQAAIDAYRWSRPGDYVIWPGPNSNTFVASVLDAVPELGIRLPATAVGKTWPADGAILALAPARDGIRFSLRGLVGLNLGWSDGLELTLAGVTAAIDLRRPALELPGVGRIGTAPVARDAGA